jgi:uncharacterized lipoprotein YehR (DUF1307 family)
MKKTLLIIFTIIIGTITLSSCGAQENCRTRGAHVNQIDIKQQNNSNTDIVGLEVEQIK